MKKRRMLDEMAKAFEILRKAGLDPKFLVLSAQDYDKVRRQYGKPFYPDFGFEKYSVVGVNIISTARLHLGWDTGRIASEIAKTSMLQMAQRFADIKKDFAE